MRKIRIYIAAPWAHKDKASELKKQFEAAGLEVTSRWMDLHLPKPNVADDGGIAYDEEVLRREAMEDIKDVLECDIYCVFNLEKSEGKAVELGLAIASFKGVVVVGKPLNVFQYLNGMVRVMTAEEAIAACLDYPWSEGQMPPDLIAKDKKTAIWRV